jgi:hypothetical protein
MKMKRKAKHLATQKVKELEGMINQFFEVEDSPRWSLVSVFYTEDDKYYHAFLEYDNDN